MEIIVENSITFPCANKKGKTESEQLSANVESCVTGNKNHSFYTKRHKYSLDLLTLYLSTKYIITENITYTAIEPYE